MTMLPKLEISQREISPCQQQLKIALAPVAIAPTRDLVVQEFQKEANLSGFRKGKAPRELVERRFPTEIREETIRRLTRQAFEQVTQERKLKPVGPFEITRMDFDEHKGLELEAKVEVEPEFRLAQYKGIRLTKPSDAVSAQEVDQAMAQLRESMAQLVPAGEGQPKEKRLPAMDDEFAKDAGFENLQQLREHLEAKLRERKQAHSRQAMEQQLCEELLGRHQFEVPAGLVGKQTQRLSRDFQVRLMLNGMPEEQVKQEFAKYTEQLRTNATRLVKLTFLLDRIAQQEALSVTQDEVVDRLWKLAKQWGKDPGEVRRLLDAQGLWPSVLSSIRQDKTMRLLMEAAHVEETGLPVKPV